MRHLRPRTGTRRALKLRQGEEPHRPAVTGEAEVDWAVKAVGVVMVRCFRCQHTGVCLETISSVSA
jgi:hypothetical protein